MAIMKAVRIHTYGGPDVLRYEDAPCPTSQDDEVLLRVRAAGVNPVDWKIREGYLAGMMNHSLPLILGWDVSGTVEEVGARVTNVAVGDDVYTKADTSRDGGSAQYMAVRATELAHKPRSLDHVHAAAVPLPGLTAWQALFDTGALTAGQTVLVHAAAGGVGHIAVQLAKSRGARVIGTASASNHDFLRELGVDQIIDYTTTQFEDVAHDVDLVLDTIGGDTLQRSLRVLKPGGMVISIIEPPDEAAAAASGVQARFMFAHSDGAQLEQIAALIDAGQVKPKVSKVLPLADMRKAHELIAQGHTVGKLVLEVDM